MRESIAGSDAHRVRHLLGDGFTHDLPGRVTQVLDVDVWVLDLTGDAYSLMIDGRRVVVAKRTPNWFRQNFSVAHELGHFAAHTLCDESLDAAGDHEAAANGFAAELLMPEAQLRSFDWHQLNLEVLAEQIWEWGISTHALAVRLRSLRITPNDEIAAALALKTQSMLRRHWDRPSGPDPITQRMEHAAERRVPTELTSRLEESVLGGIAPAESLAYALGVPVTELEVELPSLADPERDVDLLEGLV